MKIMMVLILLSSYSFAGITENQVSINVEQQKVDIIPKKNFHLNAEAPASLTDVKTSEIYKPSVKTEKKFSFKRDIKIENAKISFYVCDDKKTVCEQHNHDINLKTNEIKKAENHVAYNLISDFKLESTNGKPTLLVFSAPWCPACIRMQTETYNNKEVIKQIKKINFIKLNSDSADNYELSQAFKIKAIPSIILLDKNGKEAYRWLDFQNANEFAVSLNEELKKIDQAISLQLNAQLGDAKAASKLAFRAFNTLDYSEAYKWFSLTKSEKDQKYKLASEVLIEQEKAEADSKQNEEYLQTLQKAIVLTTSKLDQIRWKIDYFEKKRDLKLLTSDLKYTAEALITDIDSLLLDSKKAAVSFSESTYGNYLGFENEELLWLKSRVYGIFEMKDEKLRTNKETISLIEKRKLNILKPGEILLAVSYLKEAGEINKVENIYENLIQKYPNSYVYFEKYARFSQKNKKFEKALVLIGEALKYPEGNEPQLKLLKSQILKDLSKKSEALALIDETLNMDLIQHKKFSGTRKRLVELKEDITKK